MCVGVFCGALGRVEGCVFLAVWGVRADSARVVRFCLRKRFPKNENGGPRFFSSEPHTRTKTRLPETLRALLVAS